MRGGKLAGMLLLVQIQRPVDEFHYLVVPAMINRTPDFRFQIRDSGIYGRGSEGVRLQLGLMTSHRAAPSKQRVAPVRKEAGQP